MPKPGQGTSKLRKELTSHLTDGKVWQHSGQPRRTTQRGDPPLSDSSEEETRRYNERVEEEWEARGQTEAGKRKAVSQGSERRKKKSKKHSEEDMSVMANKLDGLHDMLKQVLGCQSVEDLHPFMKQYKSSSTIPVGTKQRGQDEDGKSLAKLVSHTHRQKETRDQQCSREKKRMTGIVKAWTFGQWMWEGPPTH